MAEYDPQAPTPTKVPPRYPPKAAPPPVPAAATGDVVVARHSREYRIRRYLVVLMFVGFGIWSAYDGWVGWPRENRLVTQLEDQRDAARAGNDTDGVARLSEELRKYRRHNDTALMLQKVLAVSLPIASAIALAFWLYRSRGEYRLTGQTLSTPGHPDVPLSAIRRLDKSLWDRKGIAVVEYELPGSTQKKKLKLDDFIYDRDATDEIFRRIELVVTAPAASGTDVASEAAPA